MRKGWHEPPAERTGKYETRIDTNKKRINTNAISMDSTPAAKAPSASLINAGYAPENNQ
jgi:hypothetical protein